MVTSQEAFSRVVPSSRGNSGSSGTTRVCCSDTTVPQMLSTAMTSGDDGRLVSGAVSVGAVSVVAGVGGDGWLRVTKRGSSGSYGCIATLSIAPDRAPTTFAG
ncbi:hypothetical protein GCM10025872_15690 [Barrientosiimonas endolithica]|uniref:Uncharacterized protein n=1 Tax=Barrientosiimonas endolithica TaxID=1535208 RepID=A0ABN6YKC9_9MICO|nr:hypothetical protein GCM10025872_15690 [Barrientosiimonas endolithica]